MENRISGVLHTYLVCLLVSIACTLGTIGLVAYGMPLLAHMCGCLALICAAFLWGIHGYTEEMFRMWYPAGGSRSPAGILLVVFAHMVVLAGASFGAMFVTRILVLLVLVYGGFVYISPIVLPVLFFSGSATILLVSVFATRRLGRYIYHRQHARSTFDFDTLDDQLIEEPG